MNETKRLTKTETEDTLLKAIFGQDYENRIEKWDCAKCQLYHECEQDNPDFDANACKLN